MDIVLIFSTVVMTMIGIIGFFIVRVINDVKRTLEETGKLRGKIDLVAMQQKNDIKRIEEKTQIELNLLSKNVCKLSDNVNKLIQILAENGIKYD